MGCSVVEIDSREISEEAVVVVAVKYQEIDLRGMQNGLDWLIVVDCEGEGEAKNGTKISVSSL